MTNKLNKYVILADGMIVWLKNNEEGNRHDNRSTKASAKEV